MSLFFRAFNFLVTAIIISSAMPAIANTTNTPELKGALCLVKANDKLVMVNEILTGKLSLPGGTIITGEEPELTAQRETWEETGLVVTVKEPLGYTRNAIVYDCISDSDVVAYQYNNVYDGYELPIWFAPHYGVESASAMLVEPDLLSADLYRYPREWSTVTSLFEKAEDQSVTFVNNLVEAAPSFNQVELGWMIELQHFMSNLPNEVGNVLSSFLLAGEFLSAPKMLLIVLPLVYWRFGREFFYTLLFSISVTSLLVLVAQQGFHLPRPHVYLPSVDLISSYGYSFPSLPVAAWFCGGFLILNIWGRLQFNRYVTGFLIMMAWMCSAKFYSASAFGIDMLVGALLGILVAWHVIRLDGKKEVEASKLLASKGIWIALTVAAAVMVTVWSIPVFTLWLAILATIAGLLFAVPHFGTVHSARHVTFIILVLLLVNELIKYSAGYVSYSGLYSLIAEALRYPLLLLTFAVIVRKSQRA
ncbi:bifunctional NUDIX hydrolase/phosphatase PAP2 family protein [Vibrio sp. TRT 17S01]|uniref:bifunctional NUDIX hydrolase/phosphatase PAP2 family protein n=1 Tax=Vibrio sp. TRT 17S01 TaxID=3418505 RepID=UPI003CF08723